MSTDMRQAYVWNIIGSTSNALMTVILCVVTSWKLGLEQSGLVSLGFGIGFIFYCIACFEVRGFQATDVTHRFSFGDYHGTRIISCLTALAFSIVYIGYFYHGTEKRMVLLSIILYKEIEAISDVYQGLFQQYDHLELSGRSLFIKSFTGMLLFSTLIITTGNLVVASLILPISSLIGVVMYDWRMARKIGSLISPSFHFDSIKEIFGACWPLAISSIINMYVLNSGKIQIEGTIPALQGYWSALFMPTSFINLLGLFLFRPMLTGMARMWNEHQYQNSRKIVRKTIFFILILGLFVILVGSIIGLPILGIIYNANLNGYLPVLTLLLVGGVGNAISTLLWHQLIVMKSQNRILLCDVITLIVTIIAVPVLTEKFSILGTSIAYLSSMTIRTLLFGFTVALTINQSIKNQYFLPDR